MPLTRASGELRPDVDVLHFPMQDTAGNRVSASITYDALEDVMPGGDTSQDALVLGKPKAGAKEGRTRCLAPGGRAASSRRSRSCRTWEPNGPGRGFPRADGHFAIGRWGR